MTPAEAHVDVTTAADHVVRVVSHEGNPSGIELTVPFEIHNRSRASVYLDTNCFGDLWAFVLRWDGEQYSAPGGMENLVVPDCRGAVITIASGRSYQGSTTLVGPWPPPETDVPFDGMYRVMVHHLFAGSVAEGGTDLREAMLLPEEVRTSNSFELAFDPQ